MNNWNQEEAAVKLKFFGLGKILPYMKPHKRLIIFMFLAVIGESALSMCIPLFQRYAINNFIEAGTLDGLSTYIVVYVCAILVQVT